MVEAVCRVNCFQGLIESEYRPPLLGNPGSLVPHQGVIIVFVYFQMIQLLESGSVSPSTPQRRELAANCNLS